MKISELRNAQRTIKHVNFEKLMNMDEAGKSSSKSTRDPSATAVNRVAPAVGGNAGQFEDSPVDLEEIQKAYYSDSYIRRSVDKISGLMFKSGWGLVSKNPTALEYVNTRLKLIAESTSIPTEELLTELGANFVTYANAPIVKTRGSENLATLQATGYYGGEPISGLFPAFPVAFKPKRDEFGNIESYEVGGGTGQGVEFSKEDICHLTYKKPTGRAFGVPYMHNAIEDVLILRNIEENVARLIYRNLFPLQVYTVGTTTPGYEAKDSEIEEVTEQVRGMTFDGMYVLPERHKIETVSNGNAMLDASAYLKYFRQRVYTGLGMSESTMGIGDSTNKSTSDNQSSDLNDLVKDFQITFATQFQEQIIKELLYEGGFDPTLNEADEVKFQFTEIEQSALMAKENHTIQLMNNNLISIDEARLRIGLEPVTDLGRFAFNLLNKSTDSEAAANAVDNKDQPENQSGKATNADPKEQNKKTTLTESKKVVKFNSEIEVSENTDKLLKQWKIIETDFSNRIEKNQSLKESIGFTVKLSKSKINSIVEESMKNNFIKNYEHSNLSVIKQNKALQLYIEEESKKVSERILKDLEYSLSKLEQKENKADFIESIFYSYQNRIKSIIKTESYRGRNLAIGLQNVEKRRKYMYVQLTEEDCKKCTIEKIELTSEWYKEVPPYHTNCECLVLDKKPQ